MMHGTELVAHDLNLNVARILNKLFDVHVAVAERSFGFVSRHHKCVFKFTFLGYNAHTLAAAAGYSLNDNRKSHVYCKLLAFFN